MTIASVHCEPERLNCILKDMEKEKYSICLERPFLLDKYWGSGNGKGKHFYIQRAEALAYLYATREPRIYDKELIVGNISSKRIAANYYSEGGSINILEDIFRLEKRSVIPLYLSKEEKKQLLNLGLRHIKHAVATKALLRPDKLRHFMDFFLPKKYYITEEAGISHLVPGHDKIINNGLQKTAELALLKLQDNNLDADQKAFYQGIRLIIGGIKKMAENLADKAEGLSLNEEPERRRELMEIAEICRRVPYYPARNFREGLQAVWLIHLALNLEDFEQGISFGRLDQFLYPLYKKDIEKGIITPDEARELIACLCLKCGETIPLYSLRINRFFGGNAVGQGITIGGTDAHGKDVSNELSKIITDAFAMFNAREPSLHARVHNDTPQWFMDSCARLIQNGSGKPSFFNDNKVTAALEEAGFKKEDARDYAVIGCVEMGSQGRTYNSSDAALFNLPLCVELALNQGTPFSRKKRIGAMTPPVNSMESFSDFVDAFRKQVEYGVKEMVEVITSLEEVYRIYRPCLLNSILTEGCLEKGKDVTWGGATYDYTSVQGVGLADTGDSLIAFKKAVFEEKYVDADTLLMALKANFKGYEKLQTRLSKRMPRYGNNNPESDAMIQLAADIYTNAVRKHKNSRGGGYIAGFYSMTCHQGFGEVTGALPNGRLAGLRFANGLSPTDGSDQSGPTALLNSVAKLDSRGIANCYAFNLKLEKKMVQGKKGIDIISSTIKSFFAIGGMQLQINVLDSEILKAAKENPRDYPGIIVRVSGYCSYFNDLSPEIQDEIIQRTAHCIN